MYQNDSRQDWLEGDNNSRLNQVSRKDYEESFTSQKPLMIEKFR